MLNVFHVDPPVEETLPSPDANEMVPPPSKKHKPPPSDEEISSEVRAPKTSSKAKG